MTRDEMTAFFAKRQAAWEAHDVHGLVEGHTEDCIIVSPMFSRVEGREAIGASYRSLFASFPEWQNTPVELIVEGDRVCELFRARATHSGDFMGIPGTGRKFDVVAVRIYGFKNDLIVHEERIYDFTGLLLQTGILKAKPAR